MANHAGFGTVIAIRQTWFKKLIRILYHSELVNPSINETKNAVSLDIFHDVPKLVLTAANEGRLQFDIKAWGNFRLTLPGSNISRLAHINLSVTVPPSVTFNNGIISFDIRVGRTRLTSHEIINRTNIPYSPVEQNYLQSAEFERSIQSIAKRLLRNIFSDPFPIPFDNFGDLISSFDYTTTIKVLDNIFLLALDVEQTAVTTNGNRNELDDITEGKDIAVWLNAAIIPHLPEVTGRVNAAVADAGAVLTSFNVTTKEGYIYLSGNASKEEGSVQFSLHAIPKFIRPGRQIEFDDEYGEHFNLSTPARNELWFDFENVEVDVDRALWVFLIEAIGLFLVGGAVVGLGEIYIQILMSMLRGNIQRSIRPGEGAALTQDFILPFTDGPPIRMKMEAIDVHEEGIFISMTVSASFRRGTITGARTIPALRALQGGHHYKVSLPFNVKEEDPYLITSWTIRRTDTNEILLTVSKQSTDADPFGLSIDSLGPVFLETPAFRIDCNVSRVVGNHTKSLQNSFFLIEIADRLDRSRPYVFWEHEIYKPNVTVEQDGSQTIHGYSREQRRSDIHLTSIPQRCRMADRYSPMVAPRPDADPERPYLQYLDELPFPADAIMENRTKLCDYCFFGGPDKDIPLVPVT